MRHAATQTASRCPRIMQLRQQLRSALSGLRGRRNAVSIPVAAFNAIAKHNGASLPRARNAQSLTEPVAHYGINAYRATLPRSKQKSHCPSASKPIRRGANVVVMLDQQNMPITSENKCRMSNFALRSHEARDTLQNIADSLRRPNHVRHHATGI